jgi:hypothetical protein
MIPHQIMCEARDLILCSNPNILHEKKTSKIKNKIICVSWAPVAHACNTSYLGGRDQKDCGLKPTQANSLHDPILKKCITKRAGGVVQGIGPELQPQ